MAPGRRLSRHGLDARSGNSPVRCWIRAHGIDNVQLTVLQECDSRDELLAAEMTWICHYRSRSRDLLNRTDGGDGVTGWSPSDVTRARITASLTGIAALPRHGHVSVAQHGPARPASALNGKPCTTRGGRPGRPGAEHSALRMILVPIGTLIGGRSDSTLTRGSHFIPGRTSQRRHRGATVWHGDVKHVLTAPRCRKPTARLIRLSALADVRYRSGPVAICRLRG
jgi:hypothetical protein